MATVWEKGDKRRKEVGNLSLRCVMLASSGLDEGLIPEDGGVDFGGEFIGDGGEGVEEFLLAFLRATTGGFVDDAGIVGIVGDGEVIGSIVGEEVDSDLVADVATFGVGDEEHGDGIALHTIGDAVGTEILFVNVDGSHGILFLKRCKCNAFWRQKQSLRGNFLQIGGKNMFLPSFYLILPLRLTESSFLCGVSLGKRRLAHTRDIIRTHR